MLQWSRGSVTAERRRRVREDARPHADASMEPRPAASGGDPASMEPRFGDRGTSTALSHFGQMSSNELQWSRGSVTAERTI